MRIAFIILGTLLLAAFTQAQGPGPAQTSATTPVLSIPSSLSLPGVAPILTGADQMSLYLPLLKGQSVAVFANQTSRVGKSHLVDTLVKRGIHIVKIFAPEHGFRGSADAGEQLINAKDAATGIPIVSLYGSKLKPSAADLANVDILLFDIQDVGARFYTYISSLQELIESAIQNNRPVIILDRPNPNGFYVDGPVLDPKFRSFVGMQPIPVVYGMTMGEYAKMLIGEQWFDPAVNRELNTDHAINASALRIDSLIRAMRKRPFTLAMHDFRLVIIPCKGYSHKSRYRLPVKPSPNLPDMQSVYLYPSFCLFEGTVISLGRGTPNPFQQFGHPLLPKNLYSFMPRSMEGAKNPPLVNQICYGYDLSKINVLKETDAHFTLKWLILAYRLYPDKDNFFTASGNFFNKLAGSDLLMQQIRQGLTEEAIRQSWEPALDNFKKIRKKYLLYAD